MATRAQKQKAFVGMSGGVDSSVSAALLKKAGYEVTGVFIKAWSPDWLPCTWRDERRDAMRVAAHLDIPFLTFDLENEYKKEVVDYMLQEYKEGKTPNPDVMCNKEIKFGSFLKKAREMGADFIATGHYAQNISNTLYAGVDKNKDQSYFLWTLNQSQLKNILFPVGGLEKAEVRKLAKKFKLPVADKKDSQGLCFIGKVEMKEFLSHYIPNQKGNVINEEGEIIGAHDGAVFYTIGERHSFEILKHTRENKPYYIIEKDIKNNTLTVSDKNIENNTKKNTLIKLRDINWIGKKPPENKQYFGRIRYRQTLQNCEIKDGAVIFTKGQTGISAGQSVVLYDDEECIGGGIIVA